ncbi:MAG: PAS domain-containing protein [Pseudomonadota bacterium]|nr:PAS domain-containing protein [Pseudomonadota bacterium]
MPPRSLAHSDPPGANPEDGARGGTLRRRILWAAVGAIALSGALVAALLGYLRQDAIRVGLAQTETLAQVIEEQTARTVQTVDVALQLATEQLKALQASGAPADANAVRQVLTRRLIELPFLRAMWVVDADGRMIYNSRDGDLGMDFSDREYFQVYRRAPDTHLFIGPPILSRTDGLWFVSMSRPLRSADGQFAGAIVTSLEPTYFERLWRSVDLSGGGSITLTRDDGVVLLRTPFDTASKGNAAADRALLTQHLGASPTGTFEHTDPVDGQSRRAAYRRLSGYPQLVVVVSQSPQLYLGVWRSLAVLTLVLWVLAIGACALLGARLTREWRRRWQSESKFRQLAEAMPQLVLVCDADGRLTYVNDRWTTATGQSPEAALHVPWQSFVHPDDRARVEQSLARDAPVEYRLRTADGTYRWHLLRGAVTRQPDGTVVSAFHTSTEIDEIRSARAALLESETELRHRAAQLQALYDSAPVGLAFVDRQLNYIDINERLASINGHAPSAHRGRSIRQMIPELANRLEPLYLAAMDSGVPVENVEVTRKSPEHPERLRYFLNSIHPVRGPDGEVMGAISSSLEITQQRQREEAHRALEAQLHQVQKLESIGELTGGVAHDFNNLLTVILGNSELLVEQLVDNPPLRMLAEMTRAAAVRGAELTHRLLAFARRQALDPRSVDVNQLLAGMDGLLRRALREDIEIELVRGAGLWPALIDAPQLESAVLNLAINARDAMPDGGRLTIETANVRLDDDYARQHANVRAAQYVMVAVSDSGHGIAAEDMTRVFEPFYTTKAAGKGTGLGLSMVYGFIKQSQGHIKIYSEPGQGTTVKMYLPRSQGQVQSVAESEFGTADLHGTETILLVEDDDLVCRYAQDQLISLGYRVIAARDGATALDIARQRHDIDLLFTDVVMPGGINGRQLADLVLQIRPHQKILFTSGYTDNAIVHQGRLDPGVHLLHKPYRRVDLALKVRAVLAGGPE